MTVGPYALKERIGRGGMGEVYRAHEAGLDREVALKRLTGDFTPEVRRRFQREARAVARLRHPNIVFVHAYGEDEDGAPYMVMELIPGPTFKRLIEADPPVPVEQALDYAAQLCQGLAHAHKAGIVHRDIKPANLMLDEDHRLRIVDFGVACVADASRAMASIVAGTPAYMSPEQVNGGPVDGRSDIFAAGAVLYELLARRPAFARQDESTAAAMHRILTQDPEPLRSLRPEVSAGVEAIVMRALAKSPEARFPDAETMRRAIEAERQRPAVGGDSIGTLPAGTPKPDEPRRRRYTAALVAAALVVLAAGATWVKWPRQLDVAAAEDLVEQADAQATQPAPKARDLFYAPQAPEARKPAAATASTAPRRRLVETRTGLKYGIQLLAPPSTWTDVDPASTFRSGDKVRLAFQSNVDGYLYVLLQGSTGRWSQIFPDPQIDNGRNTIRPFEDYLVPAAGSFTFDANPGEERLFVYLSTTPLTELAGYGTQAPAVAPIDQAAVTRLAGNIRSRDLIFEAPGPTRAAPAGAAAKPEVIVVNAANRGGPIVIPVTLVHK